MAEGIAAVYAADPAVAAAGLGAEEPMANLHGAARHLTAQLAAFGRGDWAPCRL